MTSSDALPEVSEFTSAADVPSTSNKKDKLLVIEWGHLNLYKFYPMALASSWSIRCMLYPMSVVKSRLQLQRQNNVYKGMRHAFVEILRTEGVGALYRGFWMTLPQLSASFLYSSTYESARYFLQSQLGIQHASLLSALAGGIASPCAQLVFVPTDIVAQHMMVHNNPAAFGGSKKNVAVADAVKNDGLAGRWTLGLRVVRAVYVVDGFSGFYRGFLSSIMLYIPSTMVFWSTYYHALGVFRKIRMKVTEMETGVRPRTPAEVDDRNLFLDQAISGSMGGVAAAIATNPLEMLRIRLQVHRTNYSDTISRLWKYEGSRIFTKMSVRRATSRFSRVNQWLQFARQWHVVDGNQQDVTKLGEKVAKHLAGQHKPIWHPETDCGDHVVVVNCKDVAMHAFDWKHTLYHFNKEYPRSKADIPAYQIHEYDPCRVVFLSVYSALGNNLIRRRHIQRLHLFPDTDMPDFVRRNIGNQMEQVQKIVKRSDQYTAEERAAFPRLVKFPEHHIVDWEETTGNPGRHVKPAPGSKEK